MKDSNFNRKRRIGVMLALLLPPFGLYYSTIIGGIIMTIVGALLIILLIGGSSIGLIGYILFPIISAIWAYISFD